MKTYNKEELAEIINKHSAWLRDQEGGQRADLRDAYLQGAYLQDADLRGADLQDADLQDAYLQGAYLQGAYLRGADLQDADLRGAYLRGAYLRGAYLRGAYLRGAYLRGADLQDADLRGAYLRGAYLRGAYLRGAYLRGADSEKSIIIHTVNITGSRHDVVWFGIDQINIGCERHTISEWLEKYEEIGDIHDYSMEQVSEYKQYIDFIANLWKQSQGGAKS